VAVISDTQTNKWGRRGEEVNKLERGGWKKLAGETYIKAGYATADPAGYTPASARNGNTRPIFPP
jgi:hypothetical protein